MRKYESITRYGKKRTNKMFESGEELIVEEKLDGANASMLLEDGKVRCFSRNNELDAHNTLRGFYEYAQGFADKMEAGYIYYGEWLVPHKIQYRQGCIKEFYLFDIFDINKDKYLNGMEMTSLGNKCGFIFVPTFEIGYFTSVDDVKKYVGRSQLSSEGEGVVVKYWNSDKRDAVKIVSEKFQEMKGMKPQKVKSNKDGLQQFVEATVTEARVEKLINKLVDEGVIPEEYDITDTGDILRNLGNRLYNDILEEEKDVLEDMVKKKVAKYAPIIVKKVIQGTD